MISASVPELVFERKQETRSCRAADISEDGFKATGSLLTGLDVADFILTRKQDVSKAGIFGCKSLGSTSLIMMDRSRYNNHLNLQLRGSPTEWERTTFLIKYCTTLPRNLLSRVRDSG